MDEAIPEGTFLADAREELKVALDALMDIVSRDGHRMSLFQQEKVGAAINAILRTREDFLLPLMRQARKGIHRNPPLVVFGNPRGREKLEGVRGGLMSSDVMAILYRHARDGEFYCHGFGNADIELSGSPLHGVTIDGLKEKTGVRMYGTPNGSITIAHSSKRLWEDFE